VVIIPNHAPLPSLNVVFVGVQDAQRWPPRRISVCLGPDGRAHIGARYQNVRLGIFDERFEPRFPVEIEKEGEFGARNYFNRPFGSTRSARGGRFSTLRHGWRYTVECHYCSRRFRRMRLTTVLKSHQDGHGNRCPGRRGQIVDQRLM
jgi:hypothetical protein